MTSADTHESTAPTGSIESTKLSERIFEKIAVAATESVPGAITRESKLAGLAGSKLPKFVAIVDRPSKKVSFDAELAIQFPAPARVVVQRVRETVTEHIFTLTGFKVARINVTVSTFAACSPGQRTTREDLTAHSTACATRPVRFSTTPARTPNVRQPEPLRPIVVSPSQPIQSTGFLASLPDVTPWSPSVPAPAPLQPITVIPLGGFS